MLLFYTDDDTAESRIWHTTESAAYDHARKAADDMDTTTRVYQTVIATHINLSVADVLVAVLNSTADIAEYCDRHTLRATVYKPGTITDY